MNVTKILIDDEGRRIAVDVHGDEIDDEARELAKARAQNAPAPTPASDDAGE